MRFLLPLLLLFPATFAFLSCSEGGHDQKEQEDNQPGDYTCRMCAHWEELNSLTDDLGNQSRCSENGLSRNLAQPCVVDGETYEEVVLSFGDCRRKVECPDQEYQLLGGASGHGDWDYECEFCGATVSEIDSAHDGGAENAQCSSSSILRDYGKECGDGSRATVVAFKDCAGTPSCAE